MSVDIYFDATHSAQDPANALQILSEALPGYLVRHTFTDMWRGMQLPGVASLQGSQAILMMGTTAELQADLLAADNQGVRSIQAFGDVLCIYYVRREAGKVLGIGGETKTVVSIAPLDYWGMPAYADDINGTWYKLYDVAQSVTLQYLANTVLPCASGVKAWY